MWNSRALLFVFCAANLLSCGVKGRPLPPEDPQEIGIGRPRYQGVDEELKSSEKKSKKPSPEVSP